MNIQPQQDEFPTELMTPLAAHIKRVFDENKAYKEEVTERLLKCERQRRGEYEPHIKAQIRKTGGQEIFMMITDIKCRAADAWIKDVIMNQAESTWAIDPTKEPELPPEIDQEIQATVMQEAAMLAAQGMAVEADVMEGRAEELYEEADARIKEVARERCKKMEMRISDKFDEGGFRDMQTQSIYDFTTYPATVIKGPILRERDVMEWGPNFEPVVTKSLVLDFERISPYDVYPSRDATSPQEGSFIERMKLTRDALVSMKGQKGADIDAISEVLERFPNGYRETMAHDTERDALLGKNSGAWTPDGLFDALNYWGPATGRMLREWGMVEYKGQPIDEELEYQINAYTIGGRVIKAALNPHPMKRRPYSKACFEDIPGAFWGKALPEMMSDIQTICNASARALANNMGIASGPQVEVNVDRLPPGEAITQMFPWKVWQTTTDRSGGGQPAIRFFQPNMNAQELMAVYTHFSRVADEVTGVPNYIYGSTAVSGAGRTASGLTMLMENAAKGIKHAIMNLDKATSECVQRTYEHLMFNDPDQSIKGDMKIVAAGAIGAMIREQQLIARREFMQDTLNPVDMQIIGTLGRAHMLRERAKSIFPDVDNVVPKPAQIAQAMSQQMAQQAPEQGPSDLPNQQNPAMNQA